MANFSLNQEIYINMIVLRTPYKRRGFENILAKRWEERKIRNSLSYQLVCYECYIHAKTSGQVPL